MEMFSYRVYQSAVRLRECDVAYAQSIATEDVQQYPSITMCPSYVPFHYPDSVNHMTTNMTKYLSVNVLDSLET